MTLQGTVTDGLGRGADYVGMEPYQDRFERTAGFRPYPGTLNLYVTVEERDRFEAAVDPKHIDPFTHDGERYSAVDVYPARIDDVPVAVLRMEITDHPDTIAEVIAPVRLRDDIGLEDGDEVTVRCRT